MIDLVNGQINFDDGQIDLMKKIQLIILRIM